jgi:hypothetical protein
MTRVRIVQFDGKDAVIYARDEKLRLLKERTLAGKPSATAMGFLSNILDALDRGEVVLLTPLSDDFVADRYVGEAGIDVRLTEQLTQAFLAYCKLGVGWRLEQVADIVTDVEIHDFLRDSLHPAFHPGWAKAKLRELLRPTPPKSTEVP